MEKPINIQDLVNNLESYREQFYKGCGLSKEQLYTDHTSSLSRHDFDFKKQRRSRIEIDDYTGETVNNDSSIENELDRLGIPKHKGDRTCVNNAISPYLQCGINPEGDCKTCVYYEKRKYSQR